MSLDLECRSGMVLEVCRRFIALPYPKVTLSASVAEFKWTEGAGGGKGTSKHLNRLFSQKKQRHEGMILYE